MPRNKEKGQALILVLVALSLFLIGAIGLAIDGSHLYAQRQMAQNAADAAAQAAIMSIFGHTNTTAAHPFDPGGGGFMCATDDQRTPCVYAASNGFASPDRITLDFPTSVASVPGIGPTVRYPYPFARATVTRSVKTTLMQFLGSSATTVSALAIAGITQNLSPVPIVVLHPTLDGALNLSGNPNIKICGGPRRSIQVDSKSASAISTNGNKALMDLTKAGPADDGHCTTGTGGDLAAFGGPSYPNPASPPPFLTTPLGATEHYLQPTAPISDPLETVTPPSQPVNVGTMGTKTGPIAAGTGPCPAGVKKDCYIYHPGYWPGGIDVKNETGLFAPGIYYVYGGGVQNEANANVLMATGFADDTVTKQGILIYNTGASSGANTVGPINIGTANANVNLTGTPDSSIYAGILFFQDRGTTLQLNHGLGGGGSTTLTGTIYLHNTFPGAVYQALTLGGNSGNTTLIIGEIIVDTLTMNGGPNIEMDLDPNNTLPIYQVALMH